MVAQGLAEPPAVKCNCRKFINFHKADQMVKNGEAAWIVVKRERGTHEVVCRLCKGSEEVKNCAGCRGTGKVTKPVVWDTYSEDKDIVLVSEASVDPKEKRYRPALAMKTPRVATIEAEHIERAYVLENKESEARIEEYGRLIVWSLQELGAEVIEVREGKRKVIFPGLPEPENNRKTGEGRDYDWGRAI